MSKTDNNSAIFAFGGRFLPFFAFGGQFLPFFVIFCQDFLNIITLDKKFGIKSFYGIIDKIKDKKVSDTYIHMYRLVLNGTYMQTSQTACFQFILGE
jgi:hypothetical protein